MNKKEREILNIALEECAEVTQAISKVFRFGFESCHPDNPNWTNRDHLTEEVGDLMCMIHLMMQQGIIERSGVEKAVSGKLAKLAKWSPEAVL